MKRKLIVAILAFILAIPTATIVAKDDSNKTQTQEQLAKKASKLARDEAKRLKKDGYKPIMGALPLDKQLDNAFLMMADKDENQTPLYFFGHGSAVGKTFNAASQQAAVLARQDLAANITTEVTSIIDTNLANEQLSTSEAESIQTTLIESKSFVTAKIANATTILECFRDLKNGNVEVIIRIAYPRANAMKVASEALHKQLEDKFEDFENKLNLQ